MSNFLGGVITRIDHRAGFGTIMSGEYVYGFQADDTNGFEDLAVGDPVIFRRDGDRALDVYLDYDPPAA